MIWAHGTENESFAYWSFARPASGIRLQLNLNHFAVKEHRTIREQQQTQLIWLRYGIEHKLVTGKRARLDMVLGEGRENNHSFHALNKNNHNKTNMKEFLTVIFGHSR